MCMCTCKSSLLLYMLKKKQVLTQGMYVAVVVGQASHAHVHLQELSATAVLKKKNECQVKVDVVVGQASHANVHLQEFSTTAVLKKED